MAMRVKVASIVLRLLFLGIFVYALFFYHHEKNIAALGKGVKFLSQREGDPYYEISNGNDTGEINANFSQVNISNDDQLNEISNAQLGQKVQFVIIACKGSKPHEWEGQIRQIKVLLKSAALLTSTTLKFHIVSSSEEVYNEITNITKVWPEPFKRKIDFGDRKEIYYPPDIHYIGPRSWRLCASARLFLPYVFPDLESVIFIDTDMLFMMPPEDLWRHFEYFESREILGMSPCLHRYLKDFHAFPHVGLSGVNAGIILMNMTRIRNFPPGWIKAINTSLINYHKKFVLAEQDLLNNLFSGDNSIYLYELDCEWNYRSLCQSGKNPCPGAAVRGIAILHGAGQKFSDHREPVMMRVFAAWEKYKLSSPIKELMTSLENAFDNNISFGCNTVSNIKDIFLKGLKSTLRRKGLY